MAAGPETSEVVPGSPTPDRRRRTWGIAAAALGVVGVGVVVAAILLPTTTPPPPQPSVAAQTPAAAAPPASSAAPSTGTPAVPALARSVPVELDIPSIGVHSSLLQLGANPDKTIQVPPQEKDSKAGWFTYSPTPGQLGPAVLLGHVDSAQWGPGVFYRLGALKPGQTVDVTRADATVATFAVDRVETYPKDTFPSLEVYGNTVDPQLRLITCGGIFDNNTGHYENNIVAYARLISTRSA